MGALILIFIIYNRRMFVNSVFHKIKFICAILVQICLQRYLNYNDPQKLNYNSVKMYLYKNVLSIIFHM